MPLPSATVPLSRWTRLTSTILIAAGVGLAAGVGALSKAAEQAIVEDVDQLALQKNWKYLGADRCERCHNEDLKDDRIDRSWSVQNEFGLWHQDMHSKAYVNLSNELGQRMGKLLGIDATKDDRCLSCHAMPVPEELQGDNYSLADGVSCDACHGPAREWLADHGEKSWRTKTTAEKTAMGMRDLRNPVVHVELCASCHVGDAEKKRVVTHDMYMAGHPPLPSLEPVNFAKVLKQHWIDLDKKSPEIQELVGYEKGQHRGSELYLLNGVAALLTEMRTLSSEASRHGDSGAWPELAQFDCASCHHDLRAPSRAWRSGIRNPVGPGMPDLPAWPRVMSALACYHAKVSPAPLQERLRDLDGVLGNRPFGLVTSIPSAAEGVAIECQQLLGGLAEQGTFDDAAVLRTFRELARIAATEPVDYETARQLAWGARLFAEDLGDRLPNREVVVESLETLAGYLFLDLPGGSQESMWRSLPTSLGAASAYHPEDYRREMGRIATAIGPAP